MSLLGIIMVVLSIAIILGMLAYVFVLKKKSNNKALTTFLGNSGLLVILGWVVVLGVAVYSGTQNNTTLVLSVGGILIGLLIHIRVNKILT